MLRLLTALVLIPFIAWTVLASPYWFFAAVLIITGVLAYREFDSMVAAAGIQRAGCYGIAAGLIFLLWPDPLIVIGLLTIGGLTMALRVRNLSGAMAAAATFVLGVLYIFGAWRTAIALRAMNPHLLMFALLLSWAGDTFALFIGRPFGKHKMAPIISPGKSWEGAAGSVAGAVLAGWAYAHWLIPTATIQLVLILAIGGNIAGQLGDLCESALKRGADLKDSGTLLPGHGGWLDRIDSSLFSLPMVYALLKLIWIP